jgi:hypothetical protein
MTERDDEALLEELATALTEQGELVPIDEEEVRRAEETGIEDAPLPAALAAPWRGEPDRAPRDLAAHRASRRRAALTHVAALVLGAAAAVALTLEIQKETRPDLRGDPVGTASADPPPPVRVARPRDCGACCAGADCPRATPDAKACPSGRRCIPCDPKTLAGSRYRLRLGSVMPAEAGREVMKLYPQGEPELCVRVGASAEICGSTLVGDGEQWMALPLVTAASDLAAQVSIRLRWKGVREPLATAARWTSPVAVTPTSLCKGYAVKLESEKGDLFGSVSLFLDDAHFVELARAADPAELRAHRERLVLDGLDARILETRASGDERFALAFGPYDRPTAESLRWQLLEQHQAATSTFGEDHLDR